MKNNEKVLKQLQDEISMLEKQAKAKRLRMNEIFAEKHKIEKHLFKRFFPDSLIKKYIVKEIKFAFKNIKMVLQNPIWVPYTNKTGYLEDYRLKFDAKENNIFIEFIEANGFDLDFFDYCDLPHSAKEILKYKEKMRDLDDQIEKIATKNGLDIQQAFDYVADRISKIDKR